MLNIKIYIRIVFSSLMLLPLIILAYFTLRFSESPDSLSLYFKNKTASSVKDIAWPDNGLLTLWFDSDFFVNNSKIIVDLMNKYHFSGVISISHSNRYRAQSLSVHQLIMLQNQGWEIAKKNGHGWLDGEHKINDMPSPDKRSQVIYDMSINGDGAILTNVLNKTKKRNGWIILYFHTLGGSQIERPMSIAKLNYILRTVKHSGIPVVLQEQVLKVSQ